MPDDPKPLPPPRYQSTAGSRLGNWIWRKFVAPFFGG